VITHPTVRRNLDSVALSDLGWAGGHRNRANIAWTTWTRFERNSVCLLLGILLGYCAVYLML
jgi:hypothetical protein